MQKFVRYSMDPTSPNNGGKHKSFEAMGWRLGAEQERNEAAENVIAQLRAALPETAAKPLGQVAPHGTRYQTLTKIRGPNGKTGELVAVWQVPENGHTPRLITNWLKVHRDEGETR